MNLFSELKSPLGARDWRGQGIAPAIPMGHARGAGRNPRKARFFARQKMRALIPELYCCQNIKPSGEIKPLKAREESLK